MLTKLAIWYLSIRKRSVIINFTMPRQALMPKHNYVHVENISYVEDEE